MAFKLVHISDLHLVHLQGTPWHAFLNKRITGGANLLLHRLRSHRIEVVEAALAKIAEDGFDHLVVTGDLSNLSLDGEFKVARHLLASLGNTSQISVIPGNHDVYTPGAAKARRFEAYFKNWMAGDVPTTEGEVTYPFVKLRGPVAIIGLCSAIPTPLFLATGRISSAQLNALQQILALPPVRERFAVVLVHHHLKAMNRKVEDPIRRLTNAAELQRVLAEGQAGLVCHGHSHHPSFWLAPHRGSSGGMTVSDCGSSSRAPRLGSQKGATYKVYEIDGGRLNRITTYQYRVDGSSPSGAFLVADEHTVIR